MTSDDKRTLFMYGVILGMILFGLPLNAHAVTEDPIAETIHSRWVNDWNTRARSSLTDDLMVEYRVRTLAYEKASGTFMEPTPAPTIPVKQAQKPPSRPPAPRAIPSGEWVNLVSAHFPASQVNQALSVLQCESNGDPNAKNPRSSAAGLFQFVRNTWDWVAGVTGSPTYDQGGPFNPEWNVINAAWLSRGGTDWSHWQCKP